MGAEQIGSLESAFPLLVKDEEFKGEGSREFVVAAVIHAAGSSKTSVDVYKNPFRPTRGPPVVSFRDMAMCSLSKMLSFLSFFMAQENLVWLMLSASRVSAVEDASLEIVMQAKLRKHFRSKYFEDIVAHMVARGVEEQYRDIAEQHGLGYGTVVNKPSSILNTLRMFAAKVAANLVGTGEPFMAEKLPFQVFMPVGRNLNYCFTRSVEHSVLNWLFHGRGGSTDQDSASMFVEKHCLEKDPQPYGHDPCMSMRGQSAMAVNARGKMQSLDFQKGPSKQ